MQRDRSMQILCIKNRQSRYYAEGIDLALPTLPELAAGWRSKTEILAP